MLFKACVPSKLKGGKEYSGSAGGSSFFSFVFTVVFVTMLLLWYLAGTLWADDTSFLNTDVLVVVESPTAALSVVLTSKI